jgi:hypothetical protein
MEVRSGWVGTPTKMSFRSRSAQFVIMYQISTEMFTYAADGDMFYEKAVAFSEELFHIWAEKAASHSVTIILFSRRYLSEDDDRIVEEKLWETQEDDEGRRYIDFYKVLSYGETVSHWKRLLCDLKEHLLRLHFFETNRKKMRDGWRETRHQEANSELYENRDEMKTREYCEDENEMLSTDRWSVGELSQAHNGNLLEALNLAISKLDKYCIDRDLTHTGARFCAPLSLDHLLEMEIRVSLFRTGGCRHFSWSWILPRVRFIGQIHQKAVF